MVAELVRASYLIGIPTMLKVEGSNPRASIFEFIKFISRGGEPVRIRDSRKRLLRMRATSIFGKK